ncbi:hypothetical protein HZB94_00030, partial [Candidatus Falkowbacteria bacterium]|nr:hypothetical protein [Candidatus Falkowbacteria bacterium]
VDELDAEFAYLTELSNDPFADLDGDLQMISGLTNGKTEGAEESTPAVATDSTTSSLDTNFKNMESEFSKFESDLKSLNSLGEGKSLDGIDDTLSAIDDVL